MASLFTGHKDNENASKLTREQKAEIKHVLSDKPSVYGLPKEFWNTPELKNTSKLSLVLCMSQTDPTIIFCSLVA